MASEAESLVLDLESKIRTAGLDSDPLLVMPPASAFTADDSDAPAVRYGFQIGGVALLVPLGSTTEVLDRPPVFPLPRAPRWLAGMLNIRGNVVPLFDIAELLLSRSGRPDTQRILLLGQASQAVGVYVDDLPKPLTTTGKVSGAGDIPAILRPFVVVAFSDQGAHWCEFEYENFFRHLSASGEDEVEFAD